MKTIRIGLIILLGSILVIACQPIQENENSFNKNLISKQVSEVMLDYRNSWNTDAKEVVKHYLKSDELIFYAGGEFLNYDQLVKYVEQFFIDRTTFKGDIIKNANVRVLSKESAIFSANLDYIKIDSTGSETMVTGGVTYILVHDRETWKIIHGIASYD